MPRIRKLKTPLSTYLPAAIRQAVADLKAVRKDPRYTVDMEVWHEPVAGRDNGDVVCHVCLAGATLARRTDCVPECGTTPWDFDAVLSDTLDALNDCRVGSVESALAAAGLTATRAVPKTLQSYVSNKLMSRKDSVFESGCRHLLRMADWIEKNTVPTKEDC